MDRFRRLGPLTIYGWGWDLRLPFGWWLVSAREGNWRRIYISNDATPPDSQSLCPNKGFYISRRYTPHGPQNH